MGVPSEQEERTGRLAAGKETMKNAWKFSRLAAAMLAAALLLTSGVLAAGSLVTAIGDYRPGWTKLEDAAEEGSETAQTAPAKDLAEEMEQPMEEEAAETPQTPQEGSGDKAAAPEENPDAAPAAPAEETAQTGDEELVSQTVSQESGPYIQPFAQSASDWRLLLVNPWNELPEDYAVELVSLSNGLKVDERIFEDLNDMLSACRAAGLNPIVCSAYRTGATQTRLYNNKIARLRAAGWTGDALLAEAARWVAPPGTSEHQTGLALDIVSASYQLLNDAQADTAEQKWLMEHCWEYGFILRYPEDKTEITGIGYEPWHYRYVGRETAAAIRDSGLCLEEYLAALPLPETQEAPEPAAAEDSAELVPETENAAAGAGLPESSQETVGAVLDQTEVSGALEEDAPAISEEFEKEAAPAEAPGAEIVSPDPQI